MIEREVHETTGYQHGNVIVWNCPICGCKIAFVLNVGEFLVIERGDINATHQCGISGLGAVLVEQEPDPFEVWAEDADFSVLDSE